MFSSYRTFLASSRSRGRATVIPLFALDIPAMHICGQNSIKELQFAISLPFLVAGDVLNGRCLDRRLHFFSSHSLELIPTIVNSSFSMKTCISAVGSAVLK